MTRTDGRTVHARPRRDPHGSSSTVRAEPSRRRSEQDARVDDVEAEQRAEAGGEPMSIGAITRLQRLKTGALISFSCGAGAILGKASDHLRTALSAYAHDLGLAFQIVDDLLDVEGDAAEIGKTPGKDAAAGKATFVSILGVERARAQAGLLARQAAAHLEPFGSAADLLKQAANFVVARRT